MKRTTFPAEWAIITLLTFSMLCATAQVAHLSPPGAQEGPSLSFNRRFGQPLMSWTNVAGQISTVLMRRGFDQDDWGRELTLSTDNRTLQWLDERPPSAAQFYAVTTTAETNWTARLQAALDRSRRSAGVRGVSAAVITTNGLWLGTSGTSFTAFRPEFVRPWMRFSLGSVTKTFTTALIMQLAEGGKLGLDDRIDKWLPPYPNVPPEVTVRQLLSHTSGIYNFTENPNYWAMVTKTNKVYTPEDTLKLVQQPRFPPGKSWAYSNTGFILLGLIAQAATGHAFAAEIRGRFLDPLQLTGIYLQGSEVATAERVRGYSYDWSGMLEDNAAHPIWPVQYPVAWSAGAMAGTAHDLAVWIRALYGGSILTPDSLKQMTQWHDVPSPEFGLGYGLGTMRLNSPKGDFWGHTGVITGFITHAGHSLTLNATVAVLINQDGDFYTTIWDALVDAL